MKTFIWILAGVLAWCGFVWYGAEHGWGDRHPEDYHRYIVAGQTVECASMSQAYCGVDLYNCKDGQKYTCVTNLITLP